MKLHSGSVAVITGAGSGIGRALAINLAAKGCALALADKNAQGLEETVQLLRSTTPSTCTTYVLDVGDNKAVEQFAADVVQQYGKVDLLINNAGVALGGTFEQLTLEQFEWLFQINFWGTVYGVTAFLPILKQQPDAHIVNLSSVFGLFAVPGQTAYTASKFAVRGFTETLRQELARTTVKVSSVHPGGIKTNIARNARFAKMTDEEAKRGRIYFERVLTLPPETAAAIIVQGIERNAPRILVGRDARVMDLIQRVFPVNYPRAMKALQRFIR
ncbi:short-chain dehydrogenase [Dictyobacter vulcani]|uniref:Short-chain dehydrogenase n=1 Tax=Dictyobacter vulcani TaxID=2607529 RepID=A0A5J4KIW2_9CHLR|nr:SDR family NAD(P)-dependent oxidoreductase [Dictyobacter vulcani]GER86240.1 short-chain dehydrogenase [Dictyobacter vulcani]